MYFMQKIEILFTAICMIIISVLYPNTTPKVDYTTEITVYKSICTGENLYAGNGEAGDVLYNVSFKIKGKNVGNPFKGQSPYTPTIKIYKNTKDDMKVIHPYDWGINNAESILEVPIMRNQEFEYNSNLYFRENVSPIEPGVYSAMVSVYGNTQYYENAVVIE